jgi:hypothetical protein
MSLLGDLIRLTLTDEMWQRRRLWLDNDALWFSADRVSHREDTIAACHAVADLADAHPAETSVYGMFMRRLIRRDVCYTVEMQLVACEAWLGGARAKRARPARRATSRP